MVMKLIHRSLLLVWFNHSSGDDGVTSQIMQKSRSALRFLTVIIPKLISSMCMKVFSDAHR